MITPTHGQHACLAALWNRKKVDTMAALAVVIATPFAEAADANQPMFLKVLQPLSVQTQHSNLQVLRLYQNGDS